MEAPTLDHHPADAPSQPIFEHVYRPTLLDEEKRYRLEGEILSVYSQAQGEWRIPVAAVRRVHLHYEHTKVRAYFTCAITLSDGSQLKVGNKHAAGLANVQDHAATYTPFVLALHRALVPHRDRVTFRAGSLLNFLMAGVGVFFFLAIGAVAALIQRWWIAASALLALTWIVPNLTRSRPRSYTPETVPVKFLPR